MPKKTRLLLELVVKVKRLVGNSSLRSANSSDVGYVDHRQTPQDAPQGVASGE